MRSVWNLNNVSALFSNFNNAIKHHPEMCEFPHTSDFKSIEEDYFNNLKLIICDFFNQAMCLIWNMCSTRIP